MPIDLEKLAVSAAQTIVDKAWHTQKRTPNTPMTRDEVVVIVLKYLRSAVAESEQEAERWREFGMSIVGRGDDETKWPPGVDLIEACKAEIRRLREADGRLKGLEH